jgi:hypothetical protein
VAGVVTLFYSCVVVAGRGRCVFSPSEAGEEEATVNVGDLTSSSVFSILALAGHPGCVRLTCRGWSSGRARPPVGAGDGWRRSLFFQSVQPHCSAWQSSPKAAAGRAVTIRNRNAPQPVLGYCLDDLPLGWKSQVGEAGAKRR